MPKKSNAKSRTKTNARSKTKSEPLENNIEGNNITAKNGTLPKKPPKEYMIQHHRNNMLNILQYSNATPLKFFQGDFRYSCVYCTGAFQMSSELKQHILNDHSEDKQTYLVKRRLYSYVGKLDVTALECTICGAEMDLLRDLTKHLVKCHNKLIYDDVNISHILEFKFDGEDETKCVHCPQKFSCIKSLIQHMTRHYRNHICDICSSGFVTQQSLAIHKETHLKGHYECEICNKLFKTRLYKTNHVKVVHMGVLKAKCPYCDERFQDQTKRLSHITEVHGKPKPSFACEPCNKSYDQERKLRMHIRRVHLKERNYKCEICGTSFFNKMEIKRHILKHTGEKFECTLCLKRYSRKATLNEHLKLYCCRRNTDDGHLYPFQCLHCGKRFMQNYTLEAHSKNKHSEQLQIESNSVSYDDCDFENCEILEEFELD